ncbi:MAG: DUF4282 domain-containing protein [Promicromonosporaceae bacterium]|nr:DUF4282 domain-containing protein [Promicromonosporaceae bacterium]
MTFDENPEVVPEEEIAESEPVQFVTSEEEFVSEPLPAQGPFYSEPPVAPATGSIPVVETVAPASLHQGKSFFGKLFDTQFHDYVTPSIVKVIFWLAIVVAIVVWIGAIISGFVGGASAWRGFNPWPGLAALFLGWIPPLLSLIGVRITLEGVLALIRLAKEARRIRHLLERQQR